MIFIPLPFVVTMLIIPLLPRIVQKARNGPAENIFFILLLLSYALQSVFLGLRWGYEIRAILPFQSTLAAIIAVLSWLSFRSLTTEHLLRQPGEIWPHFVPITLVIAEQFFWKEAIGATLMVIFLGYGSALFWLVRRGPDVLLSTRLDGALSSYRSLQSTAAFLITSALTDVLISIDRAFGSGIHAATVVAIANVFALLFLVVAASVASGNQSSGGSNKETEPTQPLQEPLTTVEDTTVAQLVENAMHDRKYYTDVDLNLTRLSRKLGLPARRVSEAINRVYKKSVSQYVNELRILEACRLLETTDVPISAIIFDSGFQTKSNFNREFLRQTGVSPRQFRLERRPTAPLETTIDYGES